MSLISVWSILVDRPLITNSYTIFCVLRCYLNLINVGKKNSIVPAFDSVLGHLRTELLFAEKIIQRDSFTRSLKIQWQKKAVKARKELIGRHLTVWARKESAETYFLRPDPVAPQHQNIVDPQHLLKGLGHEMSWIFVDMHG
jgi:hypothetical protein